MKQQGKPFQGSLGRGRPYTDDPRYFKKAARSYAKLSLPRNACKLAKKLN